MLADESLLAGRGAEELDEALETLASRAGGDRRVEAFVLAQRGLKLHAGFLADRSQGEPPEELGLFEAALAIRQELADEREIAESLFHIGLVHQVVRDDSPSSLPFFQESYDRAKAAGDRLLMSYAIRHVAFARQAAGDLDGAEAGQRESLQLREEAGWTAGVAAAQLALAGVLAERGRKAEAVELAQRARGTFVDLGAERLVAIVDGELEELRGDE